MSKEGKRAFSTELELRCSVLCAGFIVRAGNPQRVPGRSSARQKMKVQLNTKGR